MLPLFVRYFANLYVRSPAAFLDDSMFSPPFAAEDADEAAQRVRLPACRLHDLGQGRAFGALRNRTLVSQPDQLKVVVNWLDELRHRLPIHPFPRINFMKASIFLVI